ncbi:MAG: HEPN domain-containing protein [Deltaproteobacteria bacterium]|nr:HEPN domain-containing protein [Deltaproteobacteria bacterium]
MKTTPQHWWDYATDDLAMAGIAMQAGKPRHVAFHCQQAIEKGLKAIILARTGATPPKIHRLIQLAELAGLRDAISDEARGNIEKLQSYYTEMRYPGFDPDFAAQVTVEAAGQLFAETERTFSWLRSQST